MITAVSHRLNCDQEDCPAVVYGGDRLHTWYLAREDGWTMNKNNTRHYCLAHTLAKQCLRCAAYMRPHGRTKEQFPPDWKAVGAKGLCVSCAEKVAKGRTVSVRSQDVQLMAAVDKHLSLRPVEFRQVYEAYEDPSAGSLVAARAAQVVPDDLKEMVLG